MSLYAYEMFNPLLIPLRSASSEALSTGALDGLRGFPALGNHSVSSHFTAPYLLLPEASNPEQTQEGGNLKYLRLHQLGCWNREAYFKKQISFPFSFLKKNEIFFQVSLLLNRLSVGQWVSRLLAFPKIVLVPECGTRDCVLLCETGRPTEAGTMLLFLFLSVAPMEVFWGSIRI